MTESTPIVAFDQHATSVMAAVLSVSNSSSGRRRKLDQVPAVGDPRTLFSSTWATACGCQMERRHTRSRRKMRHALSLPTFPKVVVLQFPGPPDHLEMLNQDHDGWTIGSPPDLPRSAGRIGLPLRAHDHEDG
jgi:hypothetical protein